MPRRPIVTSSNTIILSDLHHQLAGDAVEAMITRIHHIFYGQSFDFVDPQNISELFDIESGIVEFGTVDNETAISEESIVKVVHCSRGAMRSLMTSLARPGPAGC